MDILDLMENPPDDDRRLSIEERFERFHARNPHVYDAIVELARAVKARGRRAGIAAIFERLRWDWLIETRGDEFRLNNDFRAIYARRVMERELDLAGFFEIRQRTSI